MDTRRDFLQKLGISSLVLPFMPLSGWATTKTEKLYDGPVLRVAIMGLGGYGTRVAEAMKSCVKAKLVGVISGTPSKIKDWQTKYGIPEKELL
ncbi:hypothetical protein [Pedobacter steynii]